MKYSTLIALMTTLTIPGIAFGADTQQDQGKQLFTKHCAACHGERGFATAQLEKRVGKDFGMLEKRTDLTPPLINHVVRYGIRSMPWFTRVELPDTDAAAIATYLTKPNR